MDIVLQTKDLSKSYRTQVVNKVNMTIYQGDIYGFVGENGAGKTTVIRMISGLVNPSSGNFTFLGEDNHSPKINEKKEHLRAIVESPSLFQNFSAYHNLKYQMDLLGLKDENEISRVLNEVGLEVMLEDKKSVKNYSLGMKQRLGIAIALLGDPKFIILDEPLNGVDPEGVVQIRNLILKLNHENGITFLISSHILSELGLIVNKIGFIHNGVLLSEKTISELQENETVQTFFKVDKIELAKNVVEGLGYQSIKIKDNSMLISEEVDLNAILKAFVENEITVLHMNQKENTIEDYYMGLIGGLKK